MDVCLTCYLVIHAKLVLHDTVSSLSPVSCRSCYSSVRVTSCHVFWLGISPLCRCSLCFWSSLCSRVVFFLFAFCASKVLFVVTLVRSHLSSLTHGRVVALLGTTVSECLRESSLRLCPEDFLRCSLLLNPDVSPLGFSVSQFCLIANRATSVLPDPSRRAGPHPGLSRGAP